MDLQSARVDKHYKIGKISGYFDRILAIGPHPDDIELGCFGTLARFKKEGAKVEFLVLTYGGVRGDVNDRKEEARKSAALLGVKPKFGGLEDTQVPEGNPTITIIEQVVKDFKPTAVFLNSPNDTHQDHRNGAAAALSACRFVPVILFYQTPSSTRQFNPKVFVNVSRYMKTKTKAVGMHRSQGQNVYMAEDAVMGQALFMGLQVYQGGEHYEGFEVHQLVF